MERKLEGKDRVESFIFSEEARVVFSEFLGVFRLFGSISFFNGSVTLAFDRSNENRTD